jgi:hypothetical protein
MVEGAVTLYLVDPGSGASFAAMGTVPTDGPGNFTIVIQAQRYPMRLVARGGSFRSGMDGSTIANPSPVSLLLPAGATSRSGISINPMTTFIDALAHARLAAGGTTLTAALSIATAKIELYYGLSTDPGTLAPDYTAAGVGTDAGKLGLILGALINEDQHLCPGKPGGLVAALKADISDGHFDGRKAGVAVSHCGGKLPAIAGTSDFQDALSGVQQLQDVTAAFAFGGLYGPAGNILMNQVPPVTPDLLLAPLATINAAITHAAPSPPGLPGTQSPPMMVARGAATATLLPNGKVLIAGGFDSGTTAVNSTQLYHPTTNTFSAGPPMKHARGGPTATLLPNGKVLIAGGNDGNGDLNSTELYDIATNTFAPGPSLIAARYGGAAALLPNGKVLIVGGVAYPSGPLSSTEIYDPSANSFSAGPTMSSSVAPTAAILLPNGKVLLTGEVISGNVTMAELYNPAGNSMAERSLNTFRQYPTAALLPNGKVLIAGGFGNVNGQVVILTSTQIYDPSLDAFADGPSMSSGRWFATAAPLANGKMLILGGNAYGTNVLNSVEIYDSLTNSFTAGTPMSDPRLFGTATLLPDGRVLIAGGWNGTSSLTSTELYPP